MRMKILTTTYPGKIRKLSGELLQNRMHMRDGALSGWYTEPSLFHAIAIAYAGRRPIAVAVLLKQRRLTSSVAIYVRWKYRRRGIGTELIKRLRKRLPEKELYPLPWDDRSIEFFRSVRRRTDRWGKLLA